MVMCCPLTEPDDYCSVWNEEKRRAGKEHVCVECRGVIRKGEMHQYVTSLFDGHWSSYRTCLLCLEIAEHFSCGRGRLVETLWDDLEANFFPDMAAGGLCMQGLSPQAKQFLIDKRMEWYFDQGEIDDDVWDEWPKHKDRQRPVRPAAPPRDEDPPEYRPENYWPRQLELEEFMREYEKEKKT